MTQAGGEDAAVDLGDLISSRRPHTIFAGVGLFLVLPTFIAGAFFPSLVYELIVGHDEYGRPIPRSKSLEDAAIALVVFAGLAWATYCLLKIAVSRFEFWQHGVTVRRFRKVRRTIFYRDATRLRYRVTRHYVEGVYTGTIVHFSLRDAKGCRIAFEGRHKETLKNISFFWGSRKFERSDELDFVKMLAAEAMADRMMQDVLQNGSVEWGRCALSLTGVTAFRGKFRGTEVPFGDIDRDNSGVDSRAIYRESSRSPVVKFSTESVNFWPGLCLYCRLLEAASVQANSVEHVDA